MSELSVIVPVHNAARFLPGCLATIRANYRDGYQFIVIDDHSSDATPQLLEQARETMPWLTVLRNPENYGVARSRNRALEAADGRYLSYLDADDWYQAGHLDATLAAIKRFGVDFVRTDHIRVDGLWRTIVEAPEPVRDTVLDPRGQFGGVGRTTIVDYPFLWAGIYDRERIAPELLTFDESLRTAADRPWFWRLYLNTESTVVVGVRGYFYRKDSNPSALTQAGNPSTLHFLDAYARIRDLAVASAMPHHVEQAAYGACRIVYLHLMKRERLSRELQSELFRRSSRFLNSFAGEPMSRALAALPFRQRLVLKRVLRLERS